MNVVDTSGWLEYLPDDANAIFFAPPIHDIDHLVTPAICLYEVFKRALIAFDEERALDAIGLMTLSEVIPLDREIAIEAARISVELKLAMTDSIILATAQIKDAILWTQDAHFEGLERVNYTKAK